VSARALAVPAPSKVNPDLAERLAAQYAHAGVDVYVHAANAEEFAQRTGKVRNINGLFRRWVEREARERESQRRLRAEQLSREHGKAASFNVELFRLIAVHRLGPRAIADVLETSIRAGHRHVSPQVVEQLRRLGDAWPEGP